MFSTTRRKRLSSPDVEVFSGVWVVMQPECKCVQFLQIVHFSNTHFCLPNVPQKNQNGTIQQHQSCTALWKHREIKFAQENRKYLLLKKWRCCWNWWKKEFQFLLRKTSCLLWPISKIIGKVVWFLWQQIPVHNPVFVTEKVAKIFWLQRSCRCFELEDAYQLGLIKQWILYNKAYTCTVCGQ